MRLVRELVSLADEGSITQRALLWLLLWPLLLAARFAGFLPSDFAGDGEWFSDQPKIQLATWNPAQSRKAIQAIVSTPPSTPPNASTANGHLGARG